MGTTPPILDQILQLTTVGMIAGWVAVFIHALNRKSWKAAILVALVPFYPIPYVLKLEESRVKKILAVLTMGALLLFSLAFILKTLLVPGEG